MLAVATFCLVVLGKAQGAPPQTIKPVVVRQVDNASVTRLVQSWGWSPKDNFGVSNFPLLATAQIGAVHVLIGSEAFNPTKPVRRLVIDAARWSGKPSVRVGHATGTIDLGKGMRAAELRRRIAAIAAKAR